MGKRLSMVSRLLFSAMLCLCLSAPMALAAEGAQAIEGWEKGAPYHRLYNPDKYTSFRGTVKEIMDVAPMQGMAPGTGLLVRTVKGKEIAVHLGPKSFVDVSVIGLKVGDKVKLMGAFASIGEKQFFIASKVKKGEFVQVKLRRTSDGVPFWVMSTAELAAFTAEFGPQPTDGEAKSSGPRFFTTDPGTPIQDQRRQELLGDKRT
jgi:hypothetical protein